MHDAPHEPVAKLTQYDIVVAVQIKVASDYAQALLVIWL
jgi:hypothetical protein